MHGWYWGRQGEDAWEEGARYLLARCVAGPEYEVPEALRGLAMGVVTALMKAGLPIFDQEADAEEPSTGVELAVASGQPGPRVAWVQHPVLDMNSELWRRQQTVMHQALHEVLAANGYRLADEGTPGSAPTVLG